MFFFMPWLYLQYDNVGMSFGLSGIQLSWARLKCLTERFHDFVGRTICSITEFDYPLLVKVCSIVDICNKSLNCQSSYLNDTYLTPIS